MKYQVKYSKSVRIWLFVGLVMVFVQVIVGGITRLTESGLSITKWEVVSGTLPPMTDAAWDIEFELYKNTPQYREINEGMELVDFKFIYFWEYIHRFWARLMGFVFLFPFLWFLYKKKIDRLLLKKLGLVVLLAMLAATFGWIMVASGLIERPWVNAYKLAIHLSIAFAVYSALFWAYLFASDISIVRLDDRTKSIRKLLLVFCGILLVQIFLGGVLSGMKAAVVFPTWPDMNGKYLPSVIFDISEWNSENFNQYDKNIFMASLIHFLHRNTAYLLVLSGSYFIYRLIRVRSLLDSVQSDHVRWIAFSFGLILFCQVTLGIITVISSKGTIPVLWGVLHQAFALCLLSTIVYSIFVLRIKK